MEETATPDAAEHEAARLRGPKRLLAAGPIASFVLALASGLLGLDGTAGLFLFLLLLALTFGTSGVWIGVGLLLDEFRGDPTSLRRGVLTGVLFVATLVCMTAIGGVAATVQADA